MRALLGLVIASFLVVWLPLPAHAADSVVTLDGSGVQITTTGSADVCANSRVVLNGALFNGSWCNTPTLAEIVSFTAAGIMGGVLLEWETASEVDTAGFDIWRAADGKKGTYEKINPALIPAEGGPALGAAYTFEDYEVELGKTYWYKLEDISEDGTSVFHGPVSAAARRGAFGCSAAPGGASGPFCLLMFVAVLAGIGLARMRYARS